MKTSCRGHKTNATWQHHQMIDQAAGAEMHPIVKAWAPLLEGLHNGQSMSIAIKNVRA
jgi:hypothetical protein